MRHYSIWVCPREDSDPPFEDLPPLFLEYRIIEHSCLVIGLITGEVFGTFILWPMVGNAINSF